jgi:hypothetical protein
MLSRLYDLPLPINMNPSLTISQSRPDQFQHNNIHNNKILPPRPTRRRRRRSPRHNRRRESPILILALNHNVHRGTMLRRRLRRYCAYILPHPPLYARLRSQRRTSACAGNRSCVAIGARQACVSGPCCLCASRSVQSSRSWLGWCSYWDGCCGGVSGRGDLSVSGVQVG